MKTLLCSSCILAILLLASFVPGVKQRKINLPMGDHKGHIQWVAVTSYQPLIDSSGAVVKGAGHIRDTEKWTYDEYGDEIEDDQYYSKDKWHKTIYEYYPNGDVKEIIKDSAVRIARPRPPRPRGEHYKICDRVYYTYKYRTFDIKYNNRYDTRGNLLYSLECTCDSTGTNILSCNMNKYCYDRHGNVLQQFIFTSDTVHPISSTLYRYNSKGQLTEQDELKQTRRPDYALDLVPNEKTIFTRNFKGQIIDKATYAFQVGLISDIKTTFDITGDTTKIVETDYACNRNGNTVCARVIKQFFKEKHTIQEHHYTAEGLLTDYTISHFDGQKHLLDKSQFHTIPTTSGIRDTIMVHHIMNDAHFNQIEEDGCNNDGKGGYKYTWQYKYDTVGNWFEQIPINHGRPVEVTVRELHYFPLHD